MKLTLSRTRVPAAILMLATGLVSFGPHQEQAPTAEAVLEGHVEALGGRKALAKIKTRLSKGTVLVDSMGSLSILTLWETSTQDRLQLTQSEILGNNYEGSTEGISWTHSLMAGSRLLKDENLRRSLREAPLNAAVHWKANFLKLEYLGRETVEKIDCHVLRLTPEGGPVEKRFYGIQSGLHVRTEAKLAIEGSSVDAVLTYGDYRWVDGVRVAFEQSQSYGDIEELTIKLQSVVQNVKLPKDHFIPPAEIRGIKQAKSSG